MSLAERTREAVRERPFLRDALRAGVVNYTAAARFLDLDGDAEAVAAALRRYAEDFPDYDTDDRSASVSMESGLGPADSADDALLVVGGTAFAAGGGSLTGLLATGDADAAALAHALGCLRAEGIPVEAAGVGGESLLVVVARRAGPDALRIVEDALAAVPSADDGPA